MDNQPANHPTPYRVRPYQPEDIPAILALTRTALGDSGAVQKTEAFWHWKHQANPFGPSYGLYAWTDEEQMAVGLRVLMRWSYRTPDGQPFRAVRAVDTATHPAYQRRGIFSTLTRQAIDDLTKEGVHFIFNTPNQYSLPGYLKLGWQVVARWPLYMKILRPVRMGLRRLGLGTAPPPVDRFEEFFRSGIVPWSVFIKQYGSAVINLVDSWESRRNQVGLRTPRNLDYLQWRYGLHPHQTYGVCPYEGTAGLAGFAVVRPNVRYSWQEIVITDIFLAESSPQSGRLLLQHLARQTKGDYLVAHFAEKTLERTMLKQSGFFRLPKKGLTFTVRALNLLRSDIVDPAAWDLTLGDLEVF